MERLRARDACVTVLSAYEDFDVANHTRFSVATVVSNHDGFGGVALPESLQRTSQARKSGSLPAGQARSATAPLVSVIMPVYNCADYIRQALQSVLEQTYTNIELVIVDDGSTDGSASIARGLAPHAKIIVQPNGGVSTARNRGILASKGELVAFLDADDWWAPTIVEKMVATAAEHPECGCVYTDFTHVIDGDVVGSRLSELPECPESQVYERLAAGNFIHMSAAMVRREALSYSGLFDPAIRSAEDYDLWLRLARWEEFRCVPEVLSFYRLHGNNSVVSSKHARNALAGYKQLLQHHAADEAVLKQLTQRTGKRAFEFAYAEQQQNHCRVAASAYMESFRYGYRRLRSLVNAGRQYAKAGCQFVLGSAKSEDVPERPTSVTVSSATHAA